MENSIYLKSIPLVFEDHGNKLLKALYDQQKKSQLCDVSLVVENVSFPAHKAVLAAHSTYFQALFDRGKLTDEAGSKACNVTTIHLSSISANTFIPILHFLYTSRLHVFCENVRDLMRTARKLQISSIVQACEHLTAENVALPSVSEIRPNPTNDFTTPINQQAQSVLYVDLKSEDDDDYQVASSGRSLLDMHSDIQDQAVSQYVVDEANETKVRGGRTQKKGFPKKIHQTPSTSDSSVSLQLHSVPNISTIAPASIFGRASISQSNRSRLPLSPLFSPSSSSENGSKSSVCNAILSDNLTFSNHLESLGNVFANEPSALMLDSFHSGESSSCTLDMVDKNNVSLKQPISKTPDSLQVQSVYSMSPKLPSDQSTSSLPSSKRAKTLPPSKSFPLNKSTNLPPNFPVDLHLTTAVSSVITTTTQNSTPSVYTCKECCKYFTNITEAVNHYYSEHPVSSTGKQVHGRQTHIPDRNSHSCPHCGRLFNNKNNLKRHILIKHTTDKRFKCNICGRRYAIRQSLQYHLRSIHGKDSDGGKSNVTPPTVSSTGIPNQYDNISHLIMSSHDNAASKIQSPIKSPSNSKPLGNADSVSDYTAVTPNSSFTSSISNTDMGNIEKANSIGDQSTTSCEDLPTIQSVESMQHTSLQSKVVETSDMSPYGSDSRLVKAEPHGSNSSNMQTKDVLAFPGCVTAVSSLSVGSQQRSSEGAMLSHTVAGVDQVDLSVESLAVSGGNPFVLSGTSQLPALLPVFGGDYRRGTGSELPTSQNRVGPRLHRCDTCGRAFSTIQSYTRHRRSCNKHECPICHRGFSQMGNMRRHIKIFHSDQKPFECKVCNKAYGIQQSFRYHMRDKHGITTIATPMSKSKKMNVGTNK